jgi:hemerythrin
MAEIEEGFREQLSLLAEISEILDKTVLSKGKVDVLVELEEEEFNYIINHFREIDRKNDKFVISISNLDYTFVLKK